MNVKLITTASNYEKTARLRESLDKQGWPYHIIVHDWKGYGSKIIETYNHLKTSDVTHFFYADSYDSYVLSTMDEALNKLHGEDMIWSSEKACYPHPDKAARYPETYSTWKYLNGGGWFCSKEQFMRMVESNMPSYADVDQVYFTDYLLNTGKITLDYDCKVFQTIAFTDIDAEFEIERGRIYNKQTKQWPVIIHGNGHTPMDRIYEL